MELTARSASWAPRLRSRKPILLSHRLEQDALGSLAVPFSVEDALPGPKIQFALGDGHRHFVTNRQRAQVRRGIVLTGAAVVPVILRRPRSDSSLQPVEDVLPQSRLVIVHEDRR